MFEKGVDLTFDSSVFVLSQSKSRRSCKPDKNQQHNGTVVKMPTTQKVALITGGASGMGLAVASTLASKGDWSVHILDLNAERGNAAAKSIGAMFHETNVNTYSSLATAFKAVFQTHRRLDFVFANAGIVERANYYARHDTGDEPPPELDLLVVDIDLKSVINTTYLAQHYFRQCLNDGLGPRSVVITASCGGFYSSTVAPVYGSAKHGVVCWARSIAKRAWREDGVRINAICPGVVRTNLLTPEAWKTFPDEFFTPIEKIVEVVLMLIDGGSKPTNGNNAAHKADPVIGQTVEISGPNHYFRQQVAFCDEAMEVVMKATDVDSWAS